MTVCRVILGNPSRADTNLNFSHSSNAKVPLLMGKCPGSPEGIYHRHRIEAYKGGPSKEGAGNKSRRQMPTTARPPGAGLLAIPLIPLLRTDEPE